MSAITNSPVKEGFKQANEAAARNEESVIRLKLNEDLSAQTYTKKPTSGMYGVGAVVCAILGALTTGLDGFLVGAIAGAIIVGLISLGISLSNKSVDERKDKMRAEAEEKIRAAYAHADERTQRQVENYDRDVRGYSKKILGNAKNVSPMVDRSVDMFERMISHADSGSNMRFVESDFIYGVNNTGITYIYNSGYTNSMDDFDFSRERFRNINSPAECEGLARALAKLVIAKMMTRYPEATTTITLSHVDAIVTLHFKGANRNFVPARDIF